MGLTVEVQYRDGSLASALISDSVKSPPTILLATEVPDIFRAVGGAEAGDPVHFTRSSDGKVNGSIGWATRFSKLTQAPD